MARHWCMRAPYLSLSLPHLSFPIKGSDPGTYLQPYLSLPSPLSFSLPPWHADGMVHFQNSLACSRGLAMDLYLHPFVQLLHAEPKMIHLMHEILAAQSAQSAATTLVDARGVPVVIAIYGRDRLPWTIRHRASTLNIYPDTTLVHAPSRLANRTSANVYTNPRVLVDIDSSRARRVLFRTPLFTPSMMPPSFPTIVTVHVSLVSRHRAHRALPPAFTKRNSASAALPNAFIPHPLTPLYLWGLPGAKPC
jgi:hypothetical protein